MLNKLGEGGFGTVLLVRKKDTGKLYALKVLVKKNMKIEVRIETPRRCRSIGETRATCSAPFKNFPSLRTLPT